VTNNLYSFFPFVGNPHLTQSGLTSALQVTLVKTLENIALQLMLVKLII